MVHRRLRPLAVPAAAALALLLSACSGGEGEPESVAAAFGPEPAGDCDFDWVGLEIGVTGTATPNCGSDTVFDQEARTLDYGSTWSRRGLVCESHRRGLSCGNREGHKFTLARGSWSVS